MAAPTLKSLKVKLFTDGADKAQIVDMAKQSWIAGFTTNPSLYNKLPYTQNEFIPIMMVANSPSLLTVNAKLPANNLAEFVDYIKARPGQINYASYGNGTSSHLAALLFDRPARDGAQGRGVQSLPGAQIETRVMPRTPHRVSDHEAIGKRTVIVGAMGADREDFRSAAHQKNFFVAYPTDEFAAIGKLGKRYALHEIRTGGLRLVFGHVPLLSARQRN